MVRAARVPLAAAPRLHGDQRRVHLLQAPRRQVRPLRAGLGGRDCAGQLALGRYLRLGIGQPPITLATGQQLAGIVFTAPEGMWLQVRVMDPDHVLPQVPARGPALLEPQLQLVLQGPNKLLRHARFVSADGAGRSYQVAIPLKTALWLQGVWANDPANTWTDADWASVGAPRLWAGQPKQAVIKSSILNNSRKDCGCNSQDCCYNNAPAFVLFRIAPNPADPGVITIP